MLCEKCGAKKLENFKYCGECGFNFENSTKDIIKNENKKTFTNQTNYYRNYRNANTSYKRFKFIFSGMLILTVLLISFFIINIGIENKAKRGKRTIMIYMVGSDLESKSSMGTLDIRELLGNNIDFDKVNILLYTGGAKKWERSDISNKNHMIFKIEKDNLKRLKSYSSENDMTRAHNLTNFLNYGYKNYKAEKYSLILWNHGMGPIGGYGADEIQEKAMPINVLKLALNDSVFGKNNKLELIGFDACLMSSIEVASSLKNYAKYMISSQEVEPGTGWNYGFVSEISKSTSTEDFAKSIINYYSNTSKLYGFKGVTLSLIDLTKIDEITDKVNILFKKASEDLISDFSSISRGRRSTKEFGLDVSGSVGTDLVDLKELLNNFPNKYKKEIESVTKAVDSAVIYQRSDLPHTSGLSVYFPYSYRKDSDLILSIYSMLDFSKEYYKYINNFYRIKFGNDSNNFRLTNIPKSTIDKEISIILDDIIIKNYSEMGYLIFDKTNSNFYTPIYKGSDVKLEGNILKTKLNNKFLKVENKNSSMYLLALESQIGMDFIKYKIPVMLQKINKNDYSIEVNTGYMEYVIDKENPNGYISNIVESMKNNIPSKRNLNYKDFDYLNFLSYKYIVKDKNGNYMENWESSKTVEMFEIDTKTDFKISLVDLDKNRNYSAVFRIKDSYGNITNSKFVDVK